MAVYSTSLEVIVNNLCDNRDKPLAERIESARSKIFDFDYSLPSQPWTEDFKKYFETAFINQYLFDEIAQETVGKFKQRLYTRLLLVLPKYTAIYNILNKIDYNQITNDFYSKTNVNEAQNNVSNSKTGSKSAGSQLPENMLNGGQIGNFSKVGYANNSEIALTENEANGDSSRQFEEIRQGRNSNQLQIFTQLGEDFNNYFQQLIGEFEDLFSCLFY